MTRTLILILLRTIYQSIKDMLAGLPTAAILEGEHGKLRRDSAIFNFKFHVIALLRTQACQSVRVLEWVADTIRSRCRSWAGLGLW